MACCERLEIRQKMEMGTYISGDGSDFASLRLSFCLLCLSWESDAFLKDLGSK